MCWWVKIAHILINSVNLLLGGHVLSWLVTMLHFLPDATSQLALNALLQRCEEVLRKFVSDERLSGSCPLPR